MRLSITLLLMLTLLFSGCSINSNTPSQPFSSTMHPACTALTGGGEFANEIPTQRTELRCGATLLSGPVNITLNGRYHHATSNQAIMNFNRSYVGLGLESGNLSTELTFSKHHYRWQGQLRRDVDRWRFSNGLSFEKQYDSYDGPRLKQTRAWAGLSYRPANTPLRVGCEYNTGPGDKRNVTDYLMCGLSWEN